MNSSGTEASSDHTPVDSTVLEKLNTEWGLSEAGRVARKEDGERLMVLRWTGIQRSAELQHSMAAANSIDSAPQKTEEEGWREEGKDMEGGGKRRG